MTQKDYVLIFLALALLLPMFVPIFVYLLERFITRKDTHIVHRNIENEFYVTVISHNPKIPLKITPMLNTIKFDQQNWSIGEITSLIDDNLLVVNSINCPKLEPKEKGKFIEGIFKGIPIPSMLVVTNESDTSEWKVITSVELLITILEYLGKRFHTSDIDFPVWEGLDNKAKRVFLSRKIQLNAIMLPNDQSLDDIKDNLFY